MQHKINYLYKSIFLIYTSFLINNCLALDNNFDITTLTAITHQASNQNRPTDQDVTATLIGGNFISSTGFPVGGKACLNTHNVKYQFGNLVTTLNFSKVQGQSQLEQVLGLDTATNNPEWGNFNTGLTAKYANLQAKSQYDLNFNYIFDYTTKAKLSYASQNDQSRLSDYGKYYYNKIKYPNTNEGLKQFTTACGDSFVSEADAGVKIIATYALHFDNLADKDSFAAKLNNQVDIEEMANQIINTASKTKINVLVSLKTIQLGGIPRFLPDSEALSANATYLISSNAASAVLTCGKSEDGNLNLDACRNSVTQIIDYAHAKGEYVGIGLEKQIGINPNGHPISLAAFYYTDPTTTPWEQVLELPSQSIAMK